MGVDRVGIPGLKSDAAFDEYAEAENPSSQFEKWGPFIHSRASLVKVDKTCRQCNLNSMNINIVKDIIKLDGKNRKASFINIQSPEAYPASDRVLHIFK
ncbi:MAG: hypothetical protein AB1427_04355 [Thermodesulfobacteriota bacterium]